MKTVTFGNLCLAPASHVSLYWPFTPAFSNATAISCLFLLTFLTLSEGR